MVFVLNFLHHDDENGRHPHSSLLLEEQTLCLVSSLRIHRLVRGQPSRPFTSIIIIVLEALLVLLVAPIQESHGIRRTRGRLP